MLLTFSFSNLWLYINELNSTWKRYGNKFLYEHSIFRKFYKTIYFFVRYLCKLLLINLCLAIFLLLHQRKNTWYNSKWTDITYCLLSQAPHYQSLLAKSLDEKVVALYYTHYALAGPLNILKWCIHKEHKGFWAQYMLS